MFRSLIVLRKGVFNMKNAIIILIVATLLVLAGMGCTLAEESNIATTTQTGDYEMQVFSEQPDISIAYPNFTGNDTLNTLVETKVRGLVPENTAGVTIDYQCAVTLDNNRFVSMVFWGFSNVEGSAHPYSDIATLNIDLSTMLPITLEELYNTNTDFEALFFTKAYFPSDPVTSYSADRFSEMLGMQKDDFQVFDPFTMAGQVICFLKPDGLVLSMPAVHATGSDHFEAQLSYSDIQPFYLLSKNVWEE